MKRMRTLVDGPGMAAYRRRNFLSQLTSFPAPSSNEKEPMSTTARAQIDVATLLSESPEHRELNIKALAEKHGVGYRDMAAAAGIGVSTLSQIITLNHWPKKKLVRRQNVLDLLRKAGATEAELAVAFERVAAPVVPSSANGHAQADAEQTFSLETDMLMGKQTLTMAARKAFGLFLNPFDGEVASEAEMFLSGEIRFIREACLQTATNGAFVAVVGESGAGKTTILADLKDRVASSNKPVVWIEPSVLGMADNDRVGKALKSGDILCAGIATLDSAAKQRLTIEGRTRQFVKLLEDSVVIGNNHLLVIEEAHSLPLATLQHLKRLHERTRIGRRSALGILLIGHPELKEKLKKVREVYQRCEVIELQPLDKDLHGYLEHKATQVGKKLSELITDDGVEEIKRHLTVEQRANYGAKVRYVSLLYPLAVNNVVTAALNEAAALGAPVVDKDIVRSL